MLAVTLVGLAGCATAPPGRTADRGQVDRYVLDGRFSLRQGEQSASGRISWEHEPGIDRVLVLDPFGNGLAELEVADGTARVRLADGRVVEDTDGEALMSRLAGLPIPVAGIGEWLSGRAGDAAAGRWTTERDGLGRTQRMTRGPWVLRFEYAEALAEALPARIFANRAEALELRLSADRWTVRP